MTWSALDGSCRAVGPSGLSCRAGLKPRHAFCFYFFLLNLFINLKNFFNITKFKVKKDDITLNIEIKLFYTIFIGCHAGPF
jgi:hypothetical protein